MKNYPERRPARASKSVYRGVRAKPSPLLIAVISLLLIIIIVLSVMVVKLSFDKMRYSFPEESTSPETTAPPEETTAPPDYQSSTVYVPLSVSNQNIYTGSLILVNYAHAYVFSDSEKYIPIYGNCKYYAPRDASVKLKDEALSALNQMMAGFYNASGLSDILIKNAFMSEAEQSFYYDRRLEAEGYEAVKSKYEKPRYSDHHTGLSIDLSIYRDGATYDFTGEADYAWILNNCAGYGFIPRYPEGKASFTGITKEIQHLRYIGIPHSVYIDHHDLALEEYIDLLKNYTADTKPLPVAHNGVLYEVYYCAADLNAAATQISVPENEPYTISGNNIDGFIITVEKKADAS